MLALLVAGLTAPQAAQAVDGCRYDPNPVIGLPCEPAPEPPPASPAKMTYMEFRGATGMGALVFADGTLVSLDFATGEIVFRFTNGQEHRVHRDALPAEAREQFISLARQSAANPGFSFETGRGPAPTAGRPFVPFWGYPLRESMFRFSGRIHMKNGEDEEESPCSGPDGCRPPVMLERVEVTSPPNPPSGPLPWESPVFDWARMTDPGQVRTQLPPYLYEYDRMKWERWRAGRCEAMKDYREASWIAMATAAATCAAYFQAALAIPPPATPGSLGLAGVACAISVVSTFHTNHLVLDAAADCSGEYPGPTGWP